MIEKEKRLVRKLDYSDRIQELIVFSFISDAPLKGIENINEEEEEEFRKIGSFTNQRLLRIVWIKNYFV